MTPLLALLALQSAAYDPANDPAFAKPITLHYAMMPLRAVVKAIAQETGQALNVSGSVADLKVTALVKGLPAGRAMEAIADTMNLEWKRDAEGPMLSRPEGQLAQETAYLKEERTAVQSRTPQMALGPAATVTNVMTVQGARTSRPIRRQPGMRDVPVAARPGAISIRFDPTLLAYESSQGQFPSRLNPAAPSGDSAWAKAVLGWPSMPDQVDPAWAAPAAAAPLGKSTWESGAYALSDFLVALHDGTGLPIVADAFRVPMKSVALPPGTALAALQGLATSEGLSLKLSNGVARLRHPAFWRLREQEVPESQWTQLERNKTATLQALVTFAQGLKPAQVAAFRSQEAPLSHVPTVAVREAYPALILWNTLPNAARTALASGQAIALSQVPGASNAFGYALREAPFYRAGDPNSTLTADPRQVGLFGSPSNGSFDLRLGVEHGGGVHYTLPY